MRTNWFQSYKNTTNAKRESSKQKEQDMAHDDQWWSDEVKALESELEAKQRENKQLTQMVDELEDELAGMMRRISMLTQSNVSGVDCRSEAVKQEEYVREENEMKRKSRA